jgi:hypothetical protein
MPTEDDGFADCGGEETEEYVNLKTNTPHTTEKT